MAKSSFHHTGTNLSSADPDLAWRKLSDELKFSWWHYRQEQSSKIGKDLITLFGGSSKKGQQKAIDTAVALFDEYKQRKKEGK